MGGRNDLLTRRLVEDDVLVLDGGLATTLAARGADLSGHLWSARLLRDDPALIRGVHRAFLAAGAEVVITASYQASYEGFARDGLDDGATDDLLHRSVELARAARHDAGRGDALVAASVGPYGAAAPGFSEYRGYGGVTEDTLRSFHRRRLAVLSESGADVLAVETLPSAREAHVMVSLLDEIPGPPAWLTFTTADAHHLGDGSALPAVAHEVAAHPRIDAVGVNCLPPERVTTVLEAMRDLPVPRIVYPNLGARYDDARDVWRHRDPAGWPDPRTWRGLGARLIGGCCGTAPEDIRTLRGVLDEPG